MNKLVSIIIVSWNGGKDLKECLAALKKISYKPYEVIIVDNGSDDGSIEQVLNNFPPVRVVEGKVNNGYAEGNNIGFRHALGEYILFLNNDTLVSPNFLEPLVKDMIDNKNLAVVQPKIIFYRPGHIWHKKINSVGSFFTIYGFLNHVGFGKDSRLLQYNNKMEILSAHGSCMLLKKEVIDEVGCFDPDYFAYFEETDLCMRIWMAGYTIIYDPASFIYHKGAQTSLRFQEDYMQYHSYKNRLYTLLKNLQIKTLLVILPIHILFCEIASFSYLLIGKPNTMLSIQKALIWNIIYFAEMLNKRKKVQLKLRKIKDGDFLPHLTKSFGLSYFYYMATGNLERYNG